jgi:DNA mismatch repair protein MutS2
MNLHLTTSLPSKLEYDFRGYRLSEFEHELHMIIESLRLDVIPFATIIHGHGTGVLKKYLRDLAKKEPDLFINSDDSGNDGQTRISIKE